MATKQCFVVWVASDILSQPTLVVKLETFPEFSFFNCITYPLILPFGSEGRLQLATRTSLAATNFIFSGGPLGTTKI